jgi:hypothetical protein
MTFDVTKFLALTAVLAGASIGAGACSSSSNDGEGDTGGSSGSSGSSSGSNAGGDNSAAGSSAYAGQSSGLGGEGGAGGTSSGGAGLCAYSGESGRGNCDDTGGASPGGAGAGSGGEGGGESCLAPDAAFEGDPCADVPDTKCDGAEENFYNPFYDICAASGGSNTSVRLAFAECLEGDVCAATAAASATECWSTLAARACPVEGAAAACATIVDTCSDGLTAEACTKMLNVYTDALEFVPDCMDPNAEGYDELFVGNCKERLAACTGVPAF